MQKSRASISVTDKLAFVNELIDAQLVDATTATEIKNFYLSQEDEPAKAAKRQSKLDFSLLVFGLLGALLIGAGIILIFAHNWDFLSPLQKSFIALGNLLIWQSLALYFLLRKRHSIIWRELSALLWGLNVGASLALVSQAYHLQGDLASFLLLWFLLALPITYLLKARIAAIGLMLLALLFLILTAYLNYRQNYQPSVHWIWLMVATLAPAYIAILKKSPQALSLNFYNLLLSATGFLLLGAFDKKTPEIYLLGYFSLFGIFYFLGELMQKLATKDVKHPTNFWQKTASNSFGKVAILAYLVLLFVLSFKGIWQFLLELNWSLGYLIKFSDFYLNMAIFAVALGAFFLYQKGKKFTNLSPFAYMFIVIVLLLLAFFALPWWQKYLYVWALIINLILLLLSVYTIATAIGAELLARLNFGLAILALLIYLRFLDSNFSFIVKGSVFILLGVVFLITNLIIVKKWRQDAK